MIARVELRAEASPLEADYIEIIGTVEYPGEQIFTQRMPLRYGEMRTAGYVVYMVELAKQKLVEAIQKYEAARFMAEQGPEEPT